MKPNERKMARRQLDRVLDRFPRPAQTQRPVKGWIRAIRTALGMTARQLARRMGIAQSTLSSLEQSEQQNTISLASLQKAAEAMDCELVYVLVPRQSLDDQVRTQALKKARADLEQTGHSMALENQAVNENTYRSFLEEQTREWADSGSSRLWDEEA